MVIITYDGRGCQVFSLFAAFVVGLAVEEFVEGYVDELHVRPAGYVDPRAFLFFTCFLYVDDVIWVDGAACFAEVSRAVAMD